jgi:hypothetical protein
MHMRSANLAWSAALTFTPRPVVDSSRRTNEQINARIRNRQCSGAQVRILRKRTSARYRKRRPATAMPGKWPSAVCTASRQAGAVELSHANKRKEGPVAARHRPKPTSNRNRRGDGPAFVMTDGVSRPGSVARTHARPVRRRRRLGCSRAPSIAVPTLVRASDQGFCKIAAIGAALRRSQRIAGNSPEIPTALTRPRTPTHGTPRRRPHPVDGESVIAIAAIAAKSPQPLPSIPPSHGYVSGASHGPSDGE